MIDALVCFISGLGIGWAIDELNLWLEKKWFSDSDARMTLPRWVLPLITAIVLGGLITKNGLSTDTLATSLWAAILIQISALDLRQRVILDVVTYPTIIAALLLSLMLANIPWQSCLLGIGIGAGILIPIALISDVIYHGGAFGWGDVKLGAVLGAMIGFSMNSSAPTVVTAIMAGILLAGVVVTILLVTRVMKMSDTLAYGPFLAAGGMMALFMR